MNKRVYQWAGVTIAILFICTQTPLLSIVFSFMIIGMIPGTQLIVPSWIILFLYPVLFLGTLYWLSRQSFFIGETVNPTPRKSPKRKSKKVTATRRSNKVSPAKRRPRTAI